MATSLALTRSSDVKMTPRASLQVRSCCRVTSHSAWLSSSPGHVLTACTGRSKVKGHRSQVTGHRSVTSLNRAVAYRATEAVVENYQNRKSETHIKLEGHSIEGIAADNNENPEQGQPWVRGAVDPLKPSSTRHIWHLPSGKPPRGRALKV